MQWFLASTLCTVSDGACGRAVWTFVCKILCEDLCQADDPPLILQEQKALLTPALALLAALHASLQTDISTKHTLLAYQIQCFMRGIVVFKVCYYSAVSIS